MNLIFNTLWLVRVFSLLMLTLPLSTHAISYVQVNAEFLKRIPSQTPSGIDQYIAVSQSQGVALLNQKKEQVAQIARSTEHLDYRALLNESHQGVVATIDVNSGELLLIDVDLARQELTLKHKIKPLQTAFDALCLSATPYGIDVFVVDVQGQVVHYNTYQNHNKTWNLNEVTRFPVGPNIKSCAVNDKTQSLFITEENIGIWRYSINPEHEQIRTLIQLTKGIEVEYVDTTEAGDIAVVSPDVNTLWLLEDNGEKLSEFNLPHKVSPKTVQITRLGSSLISYIYDDSAEQLISQTITQADKPQPDTLTSIDGLIPYAQTDPVVSFGDAADDPEVWVSEFTPSASLVYATDKKYGLNVYDLSGKLIKSLPIGRINNVDIRYNVKLNGRVVDIAAASNRTSKSISVFSIDKNTGLPTHLTDIKTDLADPYGFCLSKKNGSVSAWINDTDGRFQQYDLSFKNSMVRAEKVQEWKVPSQPEGCVSDDSTQTLFYGEEATGVWRKEIAHNKVDKFIIGLTDDIAADIEGMSLYQLEGKQYLVVSSQGNNRFAVYDIEDNYRYLGVFDIKANWPNMIDGASETDGLAISSQFLGEQLPDGLLVVQDGHNVLPKNAQNFKLVSGSLLKDWINKRLSSK